MILMKELEWRWIDRLDQFVRDGRPLDVHRTMSTEDWGVYQRGMRAQANVLAPWVARRLPVPAGARDMLDIGGSHGYFSVVLCRRHPRLRATVLDLPAAVEHAAPLLEREGMGDRVVLRAGDALTDDLGEAAYDVILAFSLVHHFDDATNRRLVQRATRALRPGGYLVIGDALRPSRPGQGGQQGAFFDLYFALTSQSGLWTFDELRTRQVAAGLVPRRSMSLVPGGGFGLQVAERIESPAGTARSTSGWRAHTPLQKSLVAAVDANHTGEGIGCRAFLQIRVKRRNVHSNGPYPSGRGDGPARLVTTRRSGYRRIDA